MLDGLYSCFQEMAKISNKKNNASCVRFVNGSMTIATSVGMEPRLDCHEDGNELLNKIFSEMYSEINENHRKYLTSLVQWHIFCLNRCLSSECNSIRGRSFMPWNLSIDIPRLSDTIELWSLIRTLTFGRLSTEEDDVCRKCDFKPASHYVELCHKIPDMSVITINRVKWNGHTRIKINTPIFCGERINFRGTTTTDYDENDIIIIDVY